MNNKKWNRILSYVLVSLLSIVITVAVMLGIFLFHRQGQSKLVSLEQLITDCFIGEVDRTAMEDAAAHAMIQALGDRWSYYIPAKDYQAHLEQVKNAYVGIGISISSKAGDEGVKVVSVTADGPADKAGMQVGDLIIGVDGKNVIGMDLDAVKKLVQGEENTSVSITVSRDGAEQTLSVTRARIQTVVVKSQMLEGNIGLISIANFNENSANQTIAAINALIEQGAVRLIFDVRNNPGGYASEMVRILDRLLPEGKLFTYVDYTGEEKTDMSDATCINLPMAVLINSDSYSAAEFFAAAMWEYDAAVVVGEKTVGKGYFQITYEFSDGSAVGLSVGKYYTPKGNSLADVGITPDVPATLTEEQVLQLLAGQLLPEEDPQIQTAIQAVMSQS